MQVEVRELGPGKRQLAVTIPAEDVERALEEEVQEYRRRAALPGFRKGKVPTELIRVRYQGDIESDLLNRMIPDAYEAAIVEQKLRPAGQPHIHDIRFQMGEPLRFVADVEVWPEFEARGYHGLELEQEILDVDEGMVDEAVEMLRQNRAELSLVERPSTPGDVVEATLEAVDVHGKRLPGQKKEKVRMEAGGPRLLPEFRDASLGIRAGEARMVEVRYPEDYGDADLAGKTRRYRLVAVEIKEKKLPELDDSFARGIDSGLDLEGLRAKLRLRLEADEMIRSKERLEETVVDRLLAANPVDVPEGVVARGLARVLERARSEAGSSDEQDLREHFRPLIERMHRKDMILEAIARQESQELTEGEMEAALEQQADEAGVDVEVVRKKLDSEGELDRLRETLQERKVLDFVLSQAQIQRIRKPRLRPEAQPSRIIVP